MDSNTTTTDTTAPAATPVTTTAPGTAPGSRVTFTPEQQEQVNAIVRQRLDEDRARRPQQQPPAAAPQQTAPAPQPMQPAASSDGEQHMTPKQMRDRLELLEQRSAFDKEALPRGIDGEAAEDLFELYRVQKPSAADRRKWFDDKQARFAFKGTPAAPTAATAATAAPTAAPAATTEAPKPAAAPAAPSAHQLPTVNGVIDLFSLTQPQIHALGPKGVRENLEKLWAIGNQMSGAPERPKVPTR